ncbi:MAG: Molecular chaperone (Small heat shock protein) [candidate division TM6 bacterium GW2011_GWE2_31_21]|nr:MAG: Molecular chaperone (Small heat shock protein) [candidate division TM6 bacterium GW2011_GWE2_31_21]KKP53470.1 MAG: Molecular chaperone (Small heat shock protein) [candidate division TM6 bacterium GW2011_GWF2_33_332]
MKKALLILILSLTALPLNISSGGEETPTTKKRTLPDVIEKVTEEVKEVFSPENWTFEMNINADSPKVNISDKNDETLLIEIAMPGTDKDNIKFEIQEKSFSLEVKNKKESETKDKNFYRKEFSTQDFSISRTLSTKVKPETAKAEYKDGILKVEVKKEKPSKKEKSTYTVPIK